ncbi:MAG: SusC/RagA family TonB-linked outer membrane protein [Bacteroidales bacterium]|nr:SusC/RagA family TonB-linked outer membrane protein [Bacteroidales bacterium]
MKSNKIFSLIAAALCIASGANAQDVADSASLSLDQDVKLMFGSRNSADILGGVSTVNMKEIVDKNYSTGALDNIQAFVSGFNGSSIWGYDNYLVLVDGYPRQSYNLRPEEIDQITILKGAQAVAIYGSQAANGAILITTKRGEAHDIKISVRANTGFDVAKSYTEYLGAAEYMIWYNKAAEADGKTPAFSDEQIYYTASGKYPYQYPDVNYYSKDYIKNWKNTTNVDAEIEGGNNFATFYTNIFFNNNTDYYNFGDAKDIHNNTLAIRGNVDMKFNERITAQVDAYTNMYNVTGVRDFGDANNHKFWEDVASSNYRPHLYEPLVPIDCIDPAAAAALNTIGLSRFLVDDEYFLNAISGDAYKTNVIANAYALGKTNSKSRDFQFNTKLNFDLGHMLQGLAFHVQFGMQFATNYGTRLDNSYRTYIPTWSDLGNGPVITGVTPSTTEDKITGNQSISGSSNQRTFAGNAYFDYKRSFGDHNVYAIASVNGTQITEAATYHRLSNTNAGFQAAYNYAQRYYLDVVAGIAHSAKLAEGNRNHLTKSASIGWNISNESFFNCSFINKLTVSGSISDINQDRDITAGDFRGYMLYQGIWKEGGYFNFPSGSFTGMECKQGANVDLDFIHRKEISANLKMAMLNNSLLLDASIFKSQKTGLVQLATKEMFPAYMTSGGNTFASYINYGENEYKGFDFAINYRKAFGEFTHQLGVTGTYYVNYQSKRDDTAVDEENEPWQLNSGRYLSSIYGYKCLGYFQSEDEIAEHADQSKLGAKPRVGDLKYEDLNGDGKIDSHDQYELGRGTWPYGSPLTIGVNYTLNWKNWSLFVLGTGGFLGTGVKEGSYYWVKQEDKYTAVVRDTWTEEKPNAKYPRLTTGNGANNFQRSTFWTFKQNRFDIAKVQVTYNFPSSMFESGALKFISGCQVYVSGANLLTIAKERKHYELSVGNVPQSRFYNLGLKVTF